MADYRQPGVWRSIRFLAPARASRFLQDSLRRGQQGMLASYALIGAVIAFGGLGYMLDRYVHSSPWFLIVGLLVGIGGGFYNLVKTAWRR